MSIAPSLIRFVRELWNTIVRISFVLAFLVITGIVASTTAYVYVNMETDDAVTDHVESISGGHAGLVLGTSPWVRSGRENPYYWNRINAAVDLYSRGRIRTLLISGDNRHASYNEPEMMKSDLILRGVSIDDVKLDFGGTDTYQSMYRCRHEFGFDSIVVISQEFHNRRAVYMGRHMGLKVVGFNVPDVQGLPRVRMTIREAMARAKMLFQLHVWS